MKFFLSSLLIITLILTSIRPTYAALPNVPSPIVLVSNHTFVFRHILESNDALFLVPYYIENRVGVNGSWEDYNELAALVKVYKASGTLVRQKATPRLGAGVAGFYFSATDFATDFVWGEAARIAIEANPSLFANAQDAVTGQQGLLTSGKWIATANNTATKNQLEDRLPPMMIALEQEALSKGNTTVDFMDGPKIDTDGAAVLTLAFPYILNLAPEAFTLSSELTSPDFSPTPNALQVALDAAASTPRDAISGVATGHGLGVQPVAIFFLVLLSMPVVLLLRQLTKNDALGYSPIGVIITWGASMNIVPIALPATLAIIFFGVIGIWIWRQIPTG